MIDKQYFPPISENTKEIIKYFKDYKKETIKSNNTNKKKEKSLMNQCCEDLDKVFNDIKLYIDNKECEKLFSIINIKSQIIKKFIKNGKNIYIPFIGTSNAGKSTILNALIGYN